MNCEHTRVQVFAIDPIRLSCGTCLHRIGKHETAAWSILFKPEINSLLEWTGRYVKRWADREWAQ